MKTNGICSVLLALGMSAGLMATTAAGSILPITLQDGNSALTIDTDGVNNWSVNGQNQLVQQWFWYRLGTSGSASSIDTLGAPTLSGTNSDNTTAALTYSNTGLSVKASFLLSGVPSGGNSDLNETVTITNTSLSSQTISFFQYANFNLTGGSNDSVLFGNSNPPNTVTQTNNANASMTETIVNVTPTPTWYYEANSAGQTLAEFNNPSFTHLSDTPASGPGDETWAYEWDMTIPPGKSVLVSKDLSLNVTGSGAVPEPSTLALLLSAALGLIGCARRRRRA